MAEHRPASWHIINTLHRKTKANKKKIAAIRTQNLRCGWIQVNDECEQSTGDGEKLCALLVGFEAICWEERGVEVWEGAVVLWLHRGGCEKDMLLWPPLPHFTLPVLGFSLLQGSSAPLKVSQFLFPPFSGACSVFLFPYPLSPWLHVHLCLGIDFVKPGEVSSRSRMATSRYAKALHQQ